MKIMHNSLNFLKINSIIVSYISLINNFTSNFYELIVHVKTLKQWHKCFIFESLDANLNNKYKYRNYTNKGIILISKLKNYFWFLTRAVSYSIK